MKDRISPNGSSRKLRISGSAVASVHTSPKPILSRIGDAAVWRLPSGKPLAQFALEAGFLAPLLFAPDDRLSAPDARRAERSEKKVGQA